VIVGEFVGAGALKKIVLTLAVLGFVSAALFYWPFGGIPEAFRHLCPQCPNVDGIGSPFAKFARRAVMIGTLNAVIFSFVGGLLVLATRLHKRRR